MGDKADKKYGALEIEQNELMTLPFTHQESNTMVYFTCPEGTCLCPRSGFPDFWTAHIWYVPNRSIVELKSLKLYINKFRDESHFHEELGNIIFSDLKQALLPVYLKVVLEFTRRGNIQTDVILEHRASGYAGLQAPVWETRRNFR